MTSARDHAAAATMSRTGKIVRLAIAIEKVTVVNAQTASAARTAVARLAP